MDRRYYKGKYSLAFYSMDDELIEIFDNIKEIVTFLNKPINRYNTQYVKLLLYRALKRESHITYLLGEKMKVYMIDLNENEDTEEEK